MSKSENHWYLLGTALRATNKRPRATWLTFAVWVVLIALFVMFYQLFSRPDAATHPLLPWISGWRLFLVAMPVLTLVILGAARVLQRQVRAAYLRALQAPTAGPLMEVVERSMRVARLHPDADALRAQARALGLALYGEGEAALQALAEVQWSSRAPLIQGIGLSAEYAVALLCERDAERALRLAQQAQALCEVSPTLPGAKQSALLHRTIAAAAEAMRGTQRPSRCGCWSSGRPIHASPRSS
jgi:hypothetical protein